jgi:hypothetical protein
MTTHALTGVHTRAALRVGVDADEIALLLHPLLAYVGFPRVLQANRAVAAHLPVRLPERELRVGDHITAVIDRPGSDRSLPPLILVHALGLSRLMWRDTIAALPPDRRVIAYDLPGHGRAGDASLVTGLGHFAADLERCSTSSECPPCTSPGCPWAARSLRCSPSRIRRESSRWT